MPLFYVRPYSLISIINKQPHILVAQDDVCWFLSNSLDPPWEVGLTDIDALLVGNSHPQVVTPYFEASAHQSGWKLTWIYYSSRKSRKSFRNLAKLSVRSTHYLIHNKSDRSLSTIRLPYAEGVSNSVGSFYDHLQDFRRQNFRY